MVSPSIWQSNSCCVHVDQLIIGHLVFTSPCLRKKGYSPTYSHSSKAKEAQLSCGSLKNVTVPATSATAVKVYLSCCAPPQTHTYTRLGTRKAANRQLKKLGSHAACCFLLELSLKLYYKLKFKHLRQCFPIFFESLTIKT